MTTEIPSAHFILNDRQIPVTANLSIGRSVENGIKLDGEAVSRKHAELEVSANRYVLKDLGSHNGTYVNNQRVTGSVELRDGDTVRIGPNVMTFKKPATTLAGSSATMVWQTVDPLTLVRGDGAEFGLNRSMTVGRADDNDLRLPVESSGSQHHAKIDLVAGQAIVSDLNSKNGTWVNGKRITGPTRVNHGDKVLLGDTIFRLRVGTRPLVEETSQARSNPAMGVGLFVGGGLLTLLVAGVAIALVGGLFAAWYVYLRPTEAPPQAQVVTEAAPIGLGATQQANGEQAALRALAFVVAPVGSINSTGEAATGSGSFLTANGDVLTNFHVVGDPDTGQYHNKEGMAYIGLNWDNPADTPNTFYLAEVAQHDASLDIAVLHIVSLDNGDPLPGDLTFPYITVGSSDDLKIGDPIAVLGFPGLGGDTPTLTRGSVSGFLFDDINNLNRGWIKTDAEINPGNSGGMAINSRGELIGIPTQAYTGTEISGKISEIRPIQIALDFLNVTP
jgi:pSer/pThr/pTyr-binding forkhead associated (FHA) protein/S1-C subfamily serine protease